jgi:Fic family protein
MEKALNIDQFNAGRWEQQYGYRSFLPDPINHEWMLSNPEVQALLSDADRYIGELNAFGIIIPDVDFFIKMHIAKEATYSNRIEGTQTEIGEALLDVQDIKPEKRNDWEEVQNYITAINFAIEQLTVLPLSSRLLRQTHEQLLQGVRGKHKQPGEFRTSQNWIGGASLRDAVFIPPHHTNLNALMGDLEKFLNNEEIKIPHLVRIAIAHYQFETINPFLDGNGRLGRLLITLYLVRYGLLSKPTLYLSDFLETNKLLYYDNLTLVRERNNLAQWIRFFLVGVIETAKNSIQTFQRILKLKEQIETSLIPTLGKRTQLGYVYIKELYKSPVTTPADTAKKLNISIASANRLIAEFVQLGILSELTGFRRNRLYSFQAYINLFSTRS